MDQYKSFQCYTFVRFCYMRLWQPFSKMAASPMNGKLEIPTTFLIFVLNTLYRCLYPGFRIRRMQWLCYLLSRIWRPSWNSIWPTFVVMYISKMSIISLILVLEKGYWSANQWFSTRRIRCDIFFDIGYGSHIVFQDGGHFVLLKFDKIS